MPNLSILTTSAEAALLARLDSAAGIGIYRNADQFEDFRPSDLHETRVELPEGLPDLSMDIDLVHLRARSDAGNAERLFRSLSHLKPVYATDRRLWAAMCHGQYWRYTRWRFPGIPDGDRAQTFIRSHWFVAGGGLGGLRRNAVARLWWAAYLTVAPWERDPALEFLSHPDRFHYTKILLSSQQVYQDVIERDFGSSLHLRICLLDAFGRHRDAVSSADTLISRTCARLNLQLEYRHLLTLPPREMHTHCLDQVRLIAEQLGTGGGTSGVEPTPS